MKLFSQVQKVVLQPAILAKAKQFAQTVTATTNYSDTNQTKTGKIVNDHFVSKLGEEAATLVMSRYTNNIIGPDYEIYAAHQKSWQSDLFIDSVPLAVKTQKSSAALRYGLSWTFQCGAFRRDSILQKPEAWVVFVEYDDVHAPYQTCYVLPPFQMKQLELAEPRLAYLKGHKKVVYAHQLPAF